MLSTFKTLKIPKLYKPIVYYIEQQCKLHNITLQISKDKSVDDCAGYFEEPPALIAVATGKSTIQWILTLVHEFSHATQWIDQCKAWTDCSIGKDDVSLMWEDWLSHNREFSKRDVRKCLTILGRLEFDADKRGVKLLKQFNMPTKLIEKYSQQSWAYSMFYQVMIYTRQWYKVGKEPYNDKRIWMNMPKSLSGPYKKITPKMLKLYSVLYPQLG